MSRKKSNPAPRSSYLDEHPELHPRRLADGMIKKSPKDATHKQKKRR